MRSYTADLPGSPSDCLRQLGELARDWGADWHEEGRGGRLALPVLAGVRRGRVSGHVRVEPRDGGSRLTFEPKDEDYRVQKPIVLFLLLALAGGLAILAAPVFPALIPFIPVSAILLLGAWLFIVSGLRNSGPEEFFESLEFEMSRDSDES